jgi:CysZ protein
VLVLLGLLIPLAWWSIGSFGPWLSTLLFGDTSSWYEEGARWIVRWLSSALAALLGLWIALLLAPVLSAPALEHLVRAREAELGGGQRPRPSLWFELKCGLEAQLGGLLLGAPLWLIYWLVALLLPGAALLLLPLQALPLALGLAWNLLDYPLTLRGIRLRARWALLRQRPAPVLGFGFALALLTLIPGAALLLLPAGVVGATQLVWRLLPDSPLPAPVAGLEPLQ